MKTWNHTERHPGRHARPIEPPTTGEITAILVTALVFLSLAINSTVRVWTSWDHVGTLAIAWTVLWWFLVGLLSATLWRRAPRGTR